MDDLKYTFTCTASPVQAEGIVCGHPFYFRSRHEHWSFALTENPRIDPIDIGSAEQGAAYGFYIEEDYGTTQFAASYMPLEEARRIVERCAQDYVRSMSERDLPLDAGGSANGASARYLITVNGQNASISTLDQLRTYWPQIRDQEFTEIWLESPTGESHTVLVNRDRAWLMFLRGEGDAGFSSRNPGYAGPVDAVMEFRLSNGQVDTYPVSWTLRTEAALLATEHFFGRNEMAPWVKWHDDGSPA